MLGVPLLSFAVMALLAALLRFLYDVRQRARIQRLEFEKYFSVVNPSTLRRDSDSLQLKEDFFIGRDIDRNCLRYVALGLDAPRQQLRGAADALLNAHSAEHSFVLEVL